MGTPELPPVALCSFEKRHWSVLRGTRSVAGLLGQSLMYALTSGVGRVSRTRIKALGNENTNKYFNNFDSNDSLGL